MVALTRPAETVANLMLTLCYQTRYLLDKMIATQEEEFKKFGGVRERMHAARTAMRGEEWDKGIYSRLESATTPEDLAAIAAEIKQKVEQTVWSIKRKKRLGMTGRTGQAKSRLSRVQGGMRHKSCCRMAVDAFWGCTSVKFLYKVTKIFHRKGASATSDFHLQNFCRQTAKGRSEKCRFDRQSSKSMLSFSETPSP